MYNVWAGTTYLEVDTTDWELGGESQQTPWLSLEKMCKKDERKKWIHFAMMITFAKKSEQKNYSFTLLKPPLPRHDVLWTSFENLEIILTPFFNFCKRETTLFLLLLEFFHKKEALLWRAEVWQKLNMYLLLAPSPYTTNSFDCVTMFVWVGRGIWTDWVIGWEVWQTLSKQRLRHLSKASLALSKLPTLCQKLPILSHKMRT